MQYLKEEVKNRIVSAAIQEFTLKGYQDASMREIATKAGVAIGNIYHYFKNKDELFHSIVGPVYHEFTSMVLELYQTNGSIPDIRLLAEEITEKIIEFYEKYQTELLILLDKSKGSKFENLKEELIRLLNYRIKSELNPILQEKAIVLSDDYILYVTAATFIEGMFMILRKYQDQAKIKLLIGQLLVIYFNDFYQCFT